MHDNSNITDTLSSRLAAPSRGSLSSSFSRYRILVPSNSPWIRVSCFVRNVCWSTVMDLVKSWLWSELSCWRISIGDLSYSIAAWIWLGGSVVEGEKVDSPSSSPPSWDIHRLKWFSLRNESMYRCFFAGDTATWWVRPWFRPIKVVINRDTSAGISPLNMGFWDTFDRYVCAME